MIRKFELTEDILIKIIKLIVINNQHNRLLKVMISIGIQLCYYGIN